MLKKVWMRMGDNDDYHDFDSPYDAGYELGGYLGATGSGESDVKDIRWRDLGLEAGGFTGDNYVSLFWGDNDAQPVGKAALSATAKAEFKRGLYEGADIKVAPRKPHAKSRKSSSRRGTSTTIGGIR